MTYRMNSGPSWPTKAVKQHRRRRNKASRGGSGLIGGLGGSATGVAIVIARELRRERGLDAPPPRQAPPLEYRLARYDRRKGTGTAWVNVDGASISVRFAPGEWRCSRDGLARNPHCQHAHAVAELIERNPNVTTASQRRGPRRNVA